uniref:Prolyl 4-hydroxylase alpha subunit Fe(2+) 2OG dioxygenase domain-containing protein n=1 Tax=Spumella elongata TaxID=89044 RepID=A0A7S3MEI8_9STRA
MDKRRGLHRRVAVYLYLNPDWRHHYGGYLELWSRDLEHCEARVSPDLGTMVIFATTDFSFHGQQTPLACPPNRSHRMLAEYYYTRGRPSDECLNDNCFLVHEERYQSTRCPACYGQCFEKK